MKIIDFPQRTPEWKEARRSCLLTASDAGPFIYETDKRSVNTRRSRICRYLRAQMNLPLDQWEIQKLEDEERKLKYNSSINRGNAQEDEARELFADIHGVYITQPGLLLTDCLLYGASPDGLIHESEGSEPQAGLELKCPELETLIDWTIDYKLPDEHKNQCHFSMALSGLRRWWFMGYFRGAPPLIVGVDWNDYTQKLHDGMETFRAEMEKTKHVHLTHWKRAAQMMEGITLP